MSKMAKISLSLPPALVTDLDYLSARLGVSRSALVGEFLADGVSHVRKLLEVIPPNPTPADVLRLRGESADVIRARLDQLKGMTDDLFSE